ncbi:hypothetical protein LEP1GSC187_2009 [Leptospira santarosai str. ZUN179]|uniref:Uncharacterized protein n=1 Tax=Leptospira santarosai str. ZUN179 TaxID=1049985 RepID=M6UQ62_9LEPT|nr:hypothetical protein LEP1GSC039_0928 [Leptospira santarosai str. 2000027870]EMO46730.1 hypothetical protein LEP1GSC187_2009 [Leptospira santarosai str. ZUN179]
MFWTSSKLPTKHLKIQSLFQNYTTKSIYIPDKRPPFLFVYRKDLKFFFASMVCRNNHSQKENKSVKIYSKT